MAFIPSPTPSCSFSLSRSSSSSSSPSSDSLLSRSPASSLSLNFSSTNNSLAPSSIRPRAHSTTNKPPNSLRSPLKVSRNDIFAFSLSPQPSPPPSAPPPQALLPSLLHSPPSPGYTQLDLLRLKSSVHLKIDSGPSAKLGEGTHGTVHLAACTKPNSTLPWKLCAAKVSEDVSGSVRETAVLERLRHREEFAVERAHRSRGEKFIVGWFGLKDEDECEWMRTPEEEARRRRRSANFIRPIVLVLEYCAAGDLYGFVKRAANRRERAGEDGEDEAGRVTRRRWLRWACELAEALAWCRECNVLVGDLKPQNVLLTSELSVRLSDFNSSTILSAEESKHGRGLLDPQGTGTSVYAAPELVQPPPSPCSFPADIFALGVTLYYALTAREPYRGIQSAVERMLLISRGAFWEHECRIRWRAIEEPASAKSPGKSTQPSGRLRSVSAATEPQRRQPRWSLIPSSTVERLLGRKSSQDGPLQNPDLAELEEETEADPPPDSGPNKISFYTDGSPMMRFVGSKEMVDERIIKLIEWMCKPAASDRPDISQVLQELDQIKNFA